MCGQHKAVGLLKGEHITVVSGESVREVKKGLLGEGAAANRKTELKVVV